jgi:hypothetical protein
MKFMLMMNTPGKGPYQIGTWPKEDLFRHIQFMKDFAGKLIKQGEWVDGQGLAGPDQARLVSAAPDGRPLTDGVFPESKEFLAGFWIVDVPTAARAFELAAEISLAPGRGGKPMFLKLEVREVMSAPPPTE